LLDETVAGGVADLTRGADRAVEDIQSSDAAESGVPIVVPGQGATGTYSPAFLGAELAEDVLEGADEAGRVPGYALEAAETAAYVTGQIDESADASPGQRPPMLFTDPLTATVIGGVASAAEQPDQTERRGEAVGTVAETAAREGAEYAAENPRDVGRTALAGVAISAAGGAAVRGTSTAARLGSTATRGSRVDVDVDGDGVVADSGGPLGRVVETARERTPSVRVRRDPDAPTLQFDPELQRQIRDTITPDVSGAARRAGRRTRVAEINAQLQAGEAVARSRQVVGGVSERVRGVETPEVRLDDVTEGARTAARRVEEEADIRASNTISRTRERVERTVDRGRDAADVDVDVGVPRGRADTTTTDVFGRPEIERRLGSELRETGASVRGRGAGAVETAADAAQRVSSGVASVRGFSVGARSRLGGGADTTTADVFGRPELQSRIASEISDTGARIRSAMDRDIDMPETAADTTTADVFGRPQYPGVASAEIRSAREALADIRGGVAGRAAAAQERLSDARDLSVQVGPVRPRRAYVPDDVDEDDLLGPYADEDLGDLPAFNEEVDVDVDTSGSGATSGMPGQGSALRMRMDRGDRDTARAPADETGQRADSLLPPVIPGVNERATDPVRGALNRVGAAMEPSVTPTDSVDRGTTLTDYTATDLDTTVGGEGTGLGFGTDLDVGPVTSPRFTDLFDVDQPTRVDQTPTTTPTTTTDVDQTPTYREGEATIRPPRTPEADLPFDNDASGPEDTPDVDEETDVFGSGIIDNPFSRV
jgi:hypothetical protein